MPDNIKRAAFQPISPHIDIEALIAEHEHIKPVERLQLSEIEELNRGGHDSYYELERVIKKWVIADGRPIVISGFDKKLDPWIFSEKWLRDNHGRTEENARDLQNKVAIPLHVDHYLKSLNKLTEQFFSAPENYKDKNRQRVYLKDIDVPRVWQEKLKDVIPPFLYYLNESTFERNMSAPAGSMKRAAKGHAVAGDLMSSLPADMRAENLMSYIGHEGTYTPAHREMCGSLGQNIMIEASGSFDETGAQERPGSSIWFMTESSDRDLVAEYWHSILGHDIETEDHFAQIAAWIKAPFTVYILEQKPGDLLLIPPLAPHQVWNRGTRTTKVAWNRTTVETLALAFKEALPKARIVCRDEQYKNKSIVFYTLIKYSNLLKLAQHDTIMHPMAYDDYYRDKKSQVRQIAKDFRRLLRIFKDILISESFAPDSREKPEFVAYDSNVTCSYCRHNIFNRFLTCKHCADIITPGTDEPYDVCMECYVMGRSCACQSKLTWVEQWKWKDLAMRYDTWVDELEAFPGFAGKSENPAKYAIERARAEKVPVAELCQDALKLRPFVDVRNPKPVPASDDESDEDVQVNADGIIKKKSIKKSSSEYKNSKPCHTCCHRHPAWKMAHCTLCDKGWCFGVLWRAYEILPQQVLEDPQWECPHCQKVCAAGHCRKDARMKPYVPKQTYLGHDTKKVADIRSAEILVELGKSNRSWREENIGQASHDNRLKRQSLLAKAARESIDANGFQMLDDDDEEDHGRPADQIEEQPDTPSQITYEPIDPSIDPALMGQGAIDPAFGASTFTNGPVDSSLMNPPPRQNGGGRAGFDSPVDGTLDASQASTTAKGPVFKGRKRRAGDEAASDLRLVHAPKSKKRKTKPAEGDEEELEQDKASRQFQLEQERQTLDKARQQGREVIMLGKLQNKSLPVSLATSPEFLRVLATRPRPAPSQTNGRPEDIDSPAVLLQSDIAPPKPPQEAQRPDLPARFKVRVEADDSFGKRHGNPDRLLKRAQATKRGVEEITVNSDEEDAGEVIRNARPRAERARLRDQDDDGHDYSKGLPQNFKDRGRDRSDRPQKDRRRETMPATTNGHRMQASKAPRMRPIRASTGNLDLEADVADGEHEPDSMEFDDQADTMELARAAVAVANMDQATVGAHNAHNHTHQSAEPTAAAAATSYEDDNAKAKMMAGGLIEEDEDPFAVAQDALNSIQDNDNDDEYAVSPPRPAPTNTKAQFLPPLKANGANAPPKKKKLSPAELRALGKAPKVAGAKATPVKAETATPKRGRGRPRKSDTSLFVEQKKTREEINISSDSSSSDGDDSDDDGGRAQVQAQTAVMA